MNTVFWGKRKTKTLVLRRGIKSPFSLWGRGGKREIGEKKKKSGKG